jgi:uncharacterized protein with ATP-grasp and redox domains
MKSWERDPRTHVNVVHRLADMADMSPEDAQVVAGELERYVFDRVETGRWLPDEITRFHTQWYREVYRVMGVTDPFREVKRRSNEWAAGVIAAMPATDLRAAAVAAVIANRLDYGALEHTPEGLPVSADDFRDLPGTPFLYDDYDSMAEAAGRARRIVYLVDNSGEVLFDRALIERIAETNPSARVTVAAKSAPMLNDATAPELADLGFGAVAAVLPTGSNCFGIPEDEVSPEIVDAVLDADLVIAKGQAYLEFWLDYDLPGLFHLVYTKFPVTDSTLGYIPDGANLILGSDRYRDGRRPYGCDRHRG